LIFFEVLGGSDFPSATIVCNIRSTQNLKRAIIACSMKCVFGAKGRA
jgi:hypothetical protein